MCASGWHCGYRQPVPREKELASCFNVAIFVKCLAEPGLDLFEKENGCWAPTALLDMRRIIILGMSTRHIYYIGKRDGIPHCRNCNSSGCRGKQHIGPHLHVYATIQSGGC